MSFIESIIGQDSLAWLESLCQTVSHGGEIAPSEPDWELDY